MYWLNEIRDNKILQEEFLTSGHALNEDVEFFINPNSKELEICGKYTRGFLTRPGDLVVGTNALRYTHDNMFDILLKNKVFTKKEYALPMQRLKLSNKFYLSHGYKWSRMTKVDQKDALQRFKIAKQKNPKLEFYTDCIDDVDPYAMDYMENIKNKKSLLENNNIFFSDTDEVNFIKEHLGTPDDSYKIISCTKPEINRFFNLLGLNISNIPVVLVSKEYMQNKTGGKHSESSPQGKQSYFITSEDEYKADPTGWMAHEFGHNLFYRGIVRIDLSKYLDGLKKRYPNTEVEWTAFALQFLFLNMIRNKTKQEIYDMIKKSYKESTGWDILKEKFFKLIIGHLDDIFELVKRRH